MTPRNIAIAVGVLVVLGAAWYFMGMKGGDSANPAGGTVPTGDMTEDGAAGGSAQGASDGTFTGSIGDLAKRGGNYECTFTTDTAQSKSSGTVYVAGFQIRGDFTSVAAGQTVETHMVQDGGYDYVWSSAAPMGFKSKVTNTAPAAGYAPTSGTQDTMGESYSYKCVPWTVDKSKFALPAGVQFMGN